MITICLKSLFHSFYRHDSNARENDEDDYFCQNIDAHMRKLIESNAHVKEEKEKEKKKKKTMCQRNIITRIFRS